MPSGRPGNQAIPKSTPRLGTGTSNAKARIARALTDVGPGLREILEHVCFAGTALEAAERSLGLPRRAGKTVLKLALGRLATHYGLGC